MKGFSSENLKSVNFDLNTNLISANAANKDYNVLTYIYRLIALYKFKTISFHCIVGHAHFFERISEISLLHGAQNIHHFIDGH